MRYLLAACIVLASCSPDTTEPQLPALPCPPDYAPCDCGTLAEAQHPERCYRGEEGCRWRKGYAPAPGTILDGYCSTDGRCSCGLVCIDGRCELEPEVVAVNAALECGGGGE